MNKFFLFIILFTALVSCTKKEVYKESVIKEKSLDLQVLEAYQEGVESLESGDVSWTKNPRPVLRKSGTGEWKSTCGMRQVF